MAAWDEASGHAGQPAHNHREPEVAEPIGQEILPLGDALQRVGSKPASVAVDSPAAAAEIIRSSAPMEGGSEPPPVSVEVLPVPNRGGRRRKEERYPFGSIKVARRVDGWLEGESFLIPEFDHPKRQIAVARKRYGPGKTFETRTVDGGVRVWRKS